MIEQIAKVMGPLHRRVRGMVARGILFSSQLYVLHAHDEGRFAAMFEALDATLGEIEPVAAAGRLAAESGASGPGPGFARLA